MNCRTRKAPYEMITFAFTFGPRVTVRSVQVRRMLMSREYLIFFFMSLLVMLLLSPLSRQQTVPIIALNWLGAGLAFHLALVLHAWVLGRVRLLSRLGYTPVAYTMSLLCSELFNYTFRFKLLELSFDDYPGYLQRVLQLLPIVIALEQIFVRFLAPQLIDLPQLQRFLPRRDQPGSAAFAEWDATDPPPAALPPPRPRVEIGGYTFDPQEIRLLVAEEHYTSVVTDGGTRLVRCKISAAVDQLPEDLGMRTHRSYWIAWSYAREVVKDAPGRFSVITADGQNIPLSRDLRKAFSTQLASTGLGRTTGTRPGTRDAVDAA